MLTVSKCCIVIVNSSCFAFAFRQCIPVRCFAFSKSLSNVAAFLFDSNYVLIPVKNTLDVWDSAYIMRFFLVSYIGTSAMSFSLILYIYRFHLLGLLILSLSAGLDPCFLQLTAVGTLSVDAMVFCQHWWSSSCIRLSYASNTSICMMISFLNISEYLFCVVFNTSLNFLFLSKSCSLSSFATSKKVLHSTYFWFQSISFGLPIVNSGCRLLKLFDFLFQIVGFICILLNLCPQIGISLFEVQSV